MDRPGKSSCRNPPSAGPTCYSMNYKRRGQCVIFAHENFSVDLERLESARVDVDLLRDCFGGLGFEVIVHKDLKKKEIKSTLKKLSKDNHSDADCLVICITTHGTEERLYAEDGEYKAKILFRYFDAEKCPSLAMKPKIFFINACRGEKDDPGFAISLNFKQLDPEEIDSSDSEEDEDELDSATAKLKIPIMADFLVAYSSWFKYVSFYDTIAGSVFIQSLTRKVKEFSSKLSILDILSLVNYDVAYGCEGKEGTKQMPTTTFSLTKRLMLEPKSRK